MKGSPFTSPYLSIFVNLNQKEMIVFLLKKWTTIILSTMKFDRHIHPKMILSKENTNLWKTLPSLSFHYRRKKRFFFIKPTVNNHLIHFDQQIHPKMILYY